MQYRFDNEQNIITQVGDEGVVYLAGTNEYLSLNETMYTILSGINQNLSPETIIEQIMETYTISYDECKNEIELAIHVLKEKGVITAVA